MYYSIYFLFSLVNPLDVGVVNLTLVGFYSDKLEDMGLKSHRCRCGSTVCCSQLKSLLNWLLTAQKSLLNLLFTAQESIAGVAAHSSESMLEFYCSQLSSAHKSRFYLPCDGVFSKKSGFLER